MVLTLVCNGILINKGKVIENGAVLYGEDGKVIEVGDTDEIRSKIFRETPIEQEIHLKIIDAKKRIIMPGFICAHHHLYSSFARGLILKTKPKNFIEILNQLWWKLDKTLTLEDIYWSAIVGLIDCLKKGVTTIIDHHESQGCQLNSLNEIEKAARFIGLRVNLCYGVSNRYNKSKEGIDETERILEKIKNEQTKMVTAMAGLHASFTVTDETLKSISNLMRKYDVGVHIHCAEDIADQNDSIQKYGLRIIERLNKFNLLREKTILAHCVYIDEKEMQIIKSTNSNVVVNPESNMNNAVGCANILKMLDYGINVGVGTDGIGPDMLSQVRTLFLIQRHVMSDPNVAFIESVKAFLEGNPLICQRIFSEKIGVLEKGSPADIIIYDYLPPTEINENNYAGHLMFGLVNSTVDTVIVNGKILMREKKPIFINEDFIYKETRKLSKELWKRFESVS